MHERCRADRRNFCDERAEVHAPIGQLVEIFVHARDDWPESYADSQRPPAGIEATIEVLHDWPLPK